MIYEMSALTGVGYKAMGEEKRRKTDHGQLFLPRYGADNENTRGPLESHVKTNHMD